MDRSKYLILKNGKDITGDVKFCKYNPSTKRYDVTFQNTKTYSCSYDSIELIRNPETLNPAIVRVVYVGRELSNVRAVYIFHAKATDYWFIIFRNNSERTYNSKDLKISYSCLHENESKNCINYLRELASVNELKSDDGEILLQKQYENLNFVEADTAMAVYMNPKRHRVRTYQRDSFIFPFGGNASQFKAVKNALLNQISIIQGPPGTGKTQTILNIIANLGNGEDCTGSIKQ